LKLLYALELGECISFDLGPTVGLSRIRWYATTARPVGVSHSRTGILAKAFELAVGTAIVTRHKLYPVAEILDAYTHIQHISASDWRPSGTLFISKRQVLRWLVCVWKLLLTGA
jgi:hypothetical protein